MILSVSNRKLKIEDSLIEELMKYRQLNLPDCEQGGMLIGGIIVGTKDIIIDKSTYPMKGDIFDRFKFIRSIRHNQVLSSIWENTNYTSMYLGEWHTHPQFVPVPSYQDLENWKKLAFKANSYSELFVFIIMGIHEVGIWTIDRKSQKIEKIFGGSVDG